MRVGSAALVMDRPDHPESMSAPQAQLRLTPTFQYKSLCQQHTETFYVGSSEP